MNDQKKFIITGTLLTLAKSAAIALVIIATSFILFSEPDPEYTRMEVPDWLPPIGEMLRLLDSLDSFEEFKASEFSMPAKEFDSSSEESRDDTGLFENLHDTLLEKAENKIRMLIHYGYKNQIDWTDIEYLGYSHVFDMRELDVHFFSIYFRTSTAVYMLNFNGFYDSKRYPLYLSNLNIERISTINSPWLRFLNKLIG